MNWLRLIRWNNLFIILLTQTLVWFCVLMPLRAWTNEPLLLDVGYFSLLCLSTILIAAAGYIINDYFDIKIDAINRPEKVILESKIHRRAAIIYHSVLNIVGLGLAAIVAYKAGKMHWITLQLFCTLLLFLYSSHFKRMFVIGNVVVALLTALTVFTLFVYEPMLWNFLFLPPMMHKAGAILPNPLWMLGIYTCFAFVLTWMREVVKDMEDHIGDAAEGCVTMPIKMGLRPTSIFVQVLSLAAIIPLLIASFKVQGILGFYTFFALAIPLIIWVLYLPRKATTQHYSKMSRYLKLIMILGVGSLLIYYYQANG
jgi:4-hydroxybenzoate polyprenyltransferase